MTKIALVTGGAKGIGKAVALQLAKDGFSIWLNYRNDHTAADAVRVAVEETGQKCLLLPFDVAELEACKEALTPLLQTDVPFAVINNAGFAHDALLAMMSERQWNSVLNVHLNGFYNVTSTVLPRMLRRREGRIINMASTSGETGVGGQVNYSAAKAGLIGATRSLAVEVAKRNILVNAVAPGFIDTAMLAELPKETICATIPMRRIGKPEEVAAVVGFLCSSAASYMTGQVLSVNGGIFTG